MTPPILSRDTVRLLDRLAMEKFGVPGLLLMENAGSGAAALLAERLASGRWRTPVLVLAGTGNNGGDGFVIARHLCNMGHAASVILLGREEQIAPGSDARVNLDAARGTGVPVGVERAFSPALEQAIRGAGCIVDAVFGTGLDRPVEGFLIGVFSAVNRAGAPVLAVDIPSGLHAETGAVLGIAVRAALTATFAAAKPGLVRGRGPELSGEVAVVPISIPRALLARAREDEAAFRSWARRELRA
ncbi:MAG TPA: NAD(P)H-hydrate epimerase [Planctomycetota bacterium]|jgi:NAD(P)H-hydrate epimerase|nr:NAD(P)H-hydrate epimerase [Planctomycetota bacterium]OQC22050.1 MAG: Bifunctional NAD(P)H-hydrate repair enzyme Nnr [Planctomycetes bacterium ADurb.Bin069]HNR98067.1 NAD(P)H-hydrate epimerase [Planctomycetota bacterium]HNU25570.1 NAD(P)H-hydrate epimerase [Planctomycetota bacterium]HOE28630.1 NAD(P)H-hydrate epimerase [Planctomycetota bacterium]